MTPVVLSYMESMIGLFRAGGLSVDLTHHVLHALAGRIWGFTQEVFSDPPTPQAATGDPERRPPRSLLAPNQRPTRELCDEERGGLASGSRNVHRRSATTNGRSQTLVLTPFWASAPHDPSG
jgi:hypothetical protein